MNGILTSAPGNESRLQLPRYLLRIPMREPGCDVASQRTMLEARRRILKKLVARMNRESHVTP
jgi:hypothetical protein